MPTYLPARAADATPPFAGDLEEIRARRLVYHDVVEANTRLATVGVVLEFQARTIMHTRACLFCLNVCLATSTMVMACNNILLGTS